MNNEFLTEFWKRLKSFTWRFGAYLVTAGLAWMLDNISQLELPIWIVPIVAFALGEATKWWANYQNSFGKTFFGRIK